MHHTLKVLGLVAVLGSAISGLSQSTAFTYQGRLNDAGSPANGPYQMHFILFHYGTNVLPASKALSISPVAVSNGLFTVILDFCGAIIVRELFAQRVNIHFDEHLKRLCPP